MQTKQKWTKEGYDAWLREKLDEMDRIAAGLYARQWSRSQRAEQDYVEEQQRLAEEYNDGKENDGDNTGMDHNTEVDQGTMGRLATRSPC